VITTMNPLAMVLAGTVVIVASGVLALLLARTSQLACMVAVCAAVCGAALGFLGASLALRTGAASQLAAAWRVPGGALLVGLDPLSAFFLLPLFALAALCAVYGHAYLGARPAPAAELNFLVGAMVLVVIARHGLLFLVAWEAMTLLAYLLITFDHADPEVRRAGWIYLIASHAGVSALVGLFLALGARAGGALEFTALNGASGAATVETTGLLLLALLGFGVKAGVFGLHVWLPEAHAAAPSHVSALMSGVLIKLGIYGLLRTTLLLPPAEWFGVTLMGLGVTGALLGIVLALYQRDLKRILAYSSVENVGIILLGLGLGIWSRAHGDGRLAAIAFGGGLLHIWNHAAMKGLLFLGAGSVLHATHTKDVEQLGGLLRSMRWTGRAMIVGALAIAALPPLNGFTGEWLLYRALGQVGLKGVASSSLMAMGGAGALAAVGGLAALCFVRLVGVVLLGRPRGEATARAHESPAAMTAPLVLLATTCIAGGLLAPALVSFQAPLLRQLGAAGTDDVAAAVGLLSPVAITNAALLVAVVLAWALLASSLGRAQLSETWGCGYAAPTVRMQYTGRAFSELLAARILPRWIRARMQVRPPEGLFPGVATFASDTTDPITRAIYEPWFGRWGDRFARLRILQQGNLHIYILYVVATTIMSLAWVAARDWLVP
jgi:formate hydrogenlyase subunit 3/multisubunit Na+/H+ antiporter MnhD subunit